MKWIWLLLALSFSAAWAQDVVVETNPRNPVMGENFQILFKCRTSSGAEPQISFTPEGLELLGKQSQGVSTRTVYSQGKLQVTRELLVSYEAIAAKAGRVNLRNLVVEIDGKRFSEPVVPINIVEAPIEPRMVFVAADVPKKTLYVGEGVTVRYYIYTRAHLQAFDIKKYPSLDGFMKRFLQEPDSVQHVTIDGERYRRSIVYAARLYPEKSGELTVDPMDVSVTYAGDPFAALGMGFGFGTRDVKTRSLSSAPVKIEVRPLPTAGRPTSFTGLVGRHRFELKAGRENLLVNEPLELRLSVSGPGNLENFEAPPFWTEPQLERFDAKSDLSISGPEEAIKTFDITYLAKNRGAVPAKDIELSYFDPQLGRYESVTKHLAALTIAGGATTNAPPEDKAEAHTDQKREPPADQKGFSVIDTLPGWFMSPRWWIGCLSVLLVFLAAWRLKGYTLSTTSEAPRWHHDFQELQRGAPTSAGLTRLLHLVANSRDKQLTPALLSSALPKDSQEYFLRILKDLESREYATGKTSDEIVLDKSHLKALKKELKRYI